MTWSENEHGFSLKLILGGEGDFFELCSSDLGDGYSLLLRYYNRDTDDLRFIAYLWPDEVDTLANALLESVKRIRSYDKLEKEADDDQL